MEIHAHTHTPRKKWTHYLWEFLMLFLAVFCGFLAENWREHLVEHGKEKQFMTSLLHDLKNDTINLARTIRIYEPMIPRFDSLKKEIKNPVSEENILSAYKASVLLYYFSTFNYSDRTVEQLRSAGNFRLIRKTDISDTLIEYDRYIRHTYLGLENELIQQLHKLTELQNQIFDYDIFSFLVKRNWQRIQMLTKDSIPYILKLDIINKDKYSNFYNAFGQYELLRQRMINHSNYAKSAATRLMALIEKEYHLK